MNDELMKQSMIEEWTNYAESKNKLNFNETVMPQTAIVLGL